MVDIPKVITGKSSRNNEPIHIAVNTLGVKKWADQEGKELSEAVEKHTELLDDLIDLQLKNNTRVLTINLEHQGMIKYLKKYFEKLLGDKRIHENQVRVFIIGQWYEFDSEISETFKKLIEETKEYDKYFLNYCVNYDGQQEVLGAIRLLTRKILSDKLKEEELTPEAVKQSLYTSYFPPPRIIIEPGTKYSGLLLWDSKEALIFFTQEPWLLFEKKNYEKAISFYKKQKPKKKD